MLYRLLRNNKESGPYTALQLKEMGLKPFDLLWTEGRGAAWQYASEITELKDFAPVVEEQPFDRFFKRKEAMETVQEVAVAPKKTKPRFRISGDKIIMVEAGNMEVATNGSILQTPVARLQKETAVADEKIPATPDWQNVYAEWQQPQKKVVNKEAPVEVETKYTESLDNLKKRYAEKFLNENGGKTSFVFSASVKQNMMAAAAIIVLAVGGYVGYTLKQKSTSVTDSKHAMEKADITTDNSLALQAENDNNVTNGAAEKNDPDVQPQTNSEKNSKAIKTNENYVNSSKKPINNYQIKTSGNTIAINKPNEKTVAPGKTETDKINQDKTSVQPQTSASKTTPANTVAIQPLAKPYMQKKIDDYISVKKIGGSANGVQNVRLQVNNVSDFPIDLAVINIQYFDVKGKFQKGETMYIKNIDGGNNVEVRVPDSDKSNSIKYKVSLVSADQKTLYLVAD